MPFRRPGCASGCRASSRNVDAQIRKQKATPKPDLTPELIAYVQAKELQAGRRALRDAYMKAINKLDYYRQQPE